MPARGLAFGPAQAYGHSRNRLAEGAMSRLILILVLIAALVAAASLVASVWRRPEGASAQLPARRGGAIQKMSYSLLILVMIGVATGWLGAD